MKLKIFALVAALLLALTACVEDDDDQENDAPNQVENNDEPNNDEPNNDEPNNDEPNNDEPNNDTPSAEGMFADFFTDMMSYNTKYFIYQCECSYDDFGFASAEECIEESDFISSDDEVSTLASCIQAEADELDDPPASVNDLLECDQANIDAADSCHDAIDEAEGQCSEEWNNAVQECDLLAFGDEATDCEALIEGDEAAEAWLQEMDDAVEAACL